VGSGRYIQGLLGFTTYEIHVQILAAMAAREHFTGHPMAATTNKSAGRRLQVLYT